jgi:hypothetical protein
MQVWVHVNHPPSGGNCSVTPTAGVALTTTFAVACRHWMDAEGHYPLSYSFTAYRSGGYVGRRRQKNPISCIHFHSQLCFRPYHTCTHHAQKKRHEALGITSASIIPYMYSPHPEEMANRALRIRDMFVVVVSSLGSAKACVTGWRCQLGRIARPYR